MKKMFWRATALLVVLSGLALAGSAQAQWQTEWERVQAAARKEGKLVVSIPPSADLRKALEETVKQKFGIELEIVLSNSATTTKRVTQPARRRRAGRWPWRAASSDRRSAILRSTPGRGPWLGPSFQPWAL